MDKQTYEALKRIINSLGEFDIEFEFTDTARRNDVKRVELWIDGQGQACEYEGCDYNKHN